MPSASLLEQSAKKLGYELSRSDHKQLLAVYKLTVEEMYLLFVTTDPRKLSKTAIGVFINDLGQICGNIARMQRARSSALLDISSGDGIITHLINARKELATASDLIDALDMNTDNRRSSFYSRITAAQQQLDLALPHF